MKSKIGLFVDKMKAEGLPSLLIDTFQMYYKQLTVHQTGFIRENECCPVEEKDLPSMQDLHPFAAAGQKALHHTAIIKLNGGLGTTMGLDGPKCMLPVKDNLSFFDIVVKQVHTLNKKNNHRIPLILMNSFNTHTATLQVLQKYPEIETDIPATFLQHKYPKLLKDSLLPAQWPNDPSFEWNPPGHGDIYTALVTSGVLQKLLDAKIHYAFISNIDNLGATLDTTLLGYFAHHDFPFMMEIARRTEMDKKGGHIARRKNGQFILRERAQVTNEDIAAFEDINRYCFFNTNTIWLNLKYLDEYLTNNENKMLLPLIINKKHLVPFDKNTPMVYQLETAMGSAIGLFENAQAVVIPKERFKPVKKCDELLALWSDCYELTESYHLVTNPQRTLPPIIINLDSTFYGTYQQLQHHFPYGPPSLLQTESLSIHGDVVFGKNITVKGKIVIKNNTGKQVHIADNTEIQGEITF